MTLTKLVRNAILSAQTRRLSRPQTNRNGFKARGKRRWVGTGKKEALRRRGAQNVERESRLVLAPLSLRAGPGMEPRKWVRNVGFATRAMLGSREEERGCTEREARRGARILKRREGK
jgi:hypothetical protein